MMTDEMFIEKYEELLDKGYCNCNEMNCIDNNSPKRILNVVKDLQQQLSQKEKQLEYIRSGEYYNQLRFERDMLQNVIEKGEVSKADQEFIDMTHRNTELLDQLKQKDEIIDNMEEYVNFLRIDTPEGFIPFTSTIWGEEILDFINEYKGDNK